MSNLRILPVASSSQGVTERRIVEVASYPETMARVGDRFSDLALASIGDFLRFLAHKRPVVGGCKRLRVIETRAVVMVDGTQIPALSVWYQISHDNAEVQLLAVTDRDD